MTDSGSTGSSLLVLGKIGAILDAFDLQTPERTLAELRAATGFPSSTVQRLAASLVEHGFLDRRGDRFRIGLRLASWSASAFEGLDLGELVQPTLAEIRDASGETTCLFRADRTWRVCVAMAESRHPIRRVIALGEVMPAHVGSSGRVLLAWNEELADAVLGGQLTAVTDETLVDPVRLRASLDDVRSQGFAHTIGERALGLTSVAAPVFQRGGELFGAISVLGPSTRLTDEAVEALVPTLRAACSALGRALGADPEVPGAAAAG